MPAIDLLDWLIAVVVVLAVLWSTSRATALDAEFSEKDSQEEDKEPEENKV